MPNRWRYLLCLTLICREHGVDLKMPEFNDTYVLKQNPTNTIRLYKSTKHDQGINVSLPKNDKNWKQYLFNVFTWWETTDSDERLIRSI